MDYDVFVFTRIRPTHEEAGSLTSLSGSGSRDAADSYRRLFQGGRMMHSEIPAAKSGVLM
jgi:hypothetical protein